MPVQSQRGLLSNSGMTEGDMTQLDSYDVWFRAQVQEAIDSKKPRISHELVMADMRSAIATVASQGRDASSHIEAAFVETPPARQDRSGPQVPRR